MFGESSFPVMPVCIASKCDASGFIQTDCLQARCHHLPIIKIVDDRRQGVRDNTMSPVIRFHNNIIIIIIINGTCAPLVHHNLDAKIIEAELVSILPENLALKVRNKSII